MISHFILLIESSWTSIETFYKFEVKIFTFQQKFLHTSNFEIETIFLCQEYSIYLAENVKIVMPIFSVATIENSDIEPANRRAGPIRITHIKQYTYI